MKSEFSAMARISSSLVEKHKGLLTWSLQVDTSDSENKTSPKVQLPKMCGLFYQQGMSHSVTFPRWAGMPSDHQSYWLMSMQFPKSGQKQNICDKAGIPLLLWLEKDEMDIKGLKSVAVSEYLYTNT